MATRPRPHIQIGSITQRRDRESFREFVLEVIDDTFIFTFNPTSISLTGELFTLVLGPVDNSVPPDGDFTDPDFITDAELGTSLYVQDVKDIKGYRFVYVDLVVDDAIDYVDVYLYGVKQPKDRFQVTFNENSIIITFTESITRVPADVVTDFNNSNTPSPFEIKGKIVEIE
jgi:hypothetical protein